MLTGARSACSGSITAAAAGSAPLAAWRQPVASCQFCSTGNKRVPAPTTMSPLLLPLRSPAVWMLIWPKPWAENKPVSATKWPPVATAPGPISRSCTCSVSLPPPAKSTPASLTPLSDDDAPSTLGASRVPDKASVPALPRDNVPPALSQAPADTSSRLPLPMRRLPCCAVMPMLPPATCTAPGLPATVSLVQRPAVSSCVPGCSSVSVAPVSVMRPPAALYAPLISSVLCDWISITPPGPTSRRPNCNCSTERPSRLMWPKPASFNADSDSRVPAATASSAPASGSAHKAAGKTGAAPASRLIADTSDAPAAVLRPKLKRAAAARGSRPSRWRWPTITLPTGCALSATRWAAINRLPPLRPSV